MTAESPTIGFSSNLLVEELRLDMDTLLEQLPAGEQVTLDLIAARPNGPSISYGIEALTQAQNKPGLNVGIYMPDQMGTYCRITDPDELRRIRDGVLYHTASDEDIIALIGQLNHDDGVTAIVPLLPAANMQVGEKIREIIDPAKDVDGVSIKRTYTPATPVGMVALADHILLNLPENHPLRQKYAEHYANGTMGIHQLRSHHILVFGNGNVVGKPLLDEVLPKRDLRIPEINIYRDRDEIELGVDQLVLDAIALAFSAFGGVGGKLRKMAPNVILVDVGYAPNPETGEYCGNAHPDLVGQNGVDGRVVTSFIGGGGPVTIAMVIKRAIERKLATLQFDPFAGEPHAIVAV